MKHELALLNLWREAAAEGALTPLGRGLGPDLEALIRANALLGQGIDGISRPGYGNLSRVGIAEHEQLARRVLARVPSLFAMASAASAVPGRVVVLNSGVDRAFDSSVFFTRSLLAAQPTLASQVTLPVLDGYPAGAPKAQAPGTNRFLLYFHKLNPRSDRVIDRNDPAFATYRHSLAYQADAGNADVAVKMDEVRSQAGLQQLARAALERLFTPRFVDALERGERRSANTGTLEFTSADGRYSTRLVGDGKAVIQDAAEALMALSAVYEIAPGLRLELGGLEFGRYMPEDTARRLAWVNDAEDFYVKGPGLAERGSVNHAMAGQLLDDFFDQVDAASGPGSAGAGTTPRVWATFRFTHAEIIIPLASILMLDRVHVPVPRAGLYRYDSNPWRGEDVSPYAANIQWDAWRDAAGTTLVRMLYNERETSFKRECDHARFAPGSHFYEFQKLKACYGRRPR